LEAFPQPLSMFADLLQRPAIFQADKAINNQFQSFRHARPNQCEPMSSIQWLDYRFSNFLMQQCADYWIIFLVKPRAISPAWRRAFCVWYAARSSKSPVDCQLTRILPPDRFPFKMGLF
jgi:hypothetical protein